MIDVSEALQRIAHPRRVGSPWKVGSKKRPARPARETAAWRTVRERGLPHVLQTFPPPLWESTRWTAPQRRILAAYGVGGQLARIVNSGEGSELRELLASGKWGEAHDVLREHATREDDPHSGRWIEGVLEEVLLDLHGFRLHRCIYGQHDYFADYHHQEHCPVHRGAGTQKEWRGRRARGLTKRSAHASQRR